MPIDCEPCPGKTNANFISSSMNGESERARAHRPAQKQRAAARAAALVTEYRGAPREAAADAFDQHVLAALNTAVSHGDIERERNRRRRRVAVFADRHDH